MPSQQKDPNSAEMKRLFDVTLFAVAPDSDISRHFLPNEARPSCYRIVGAEWLGVVL